MKLGIFVLLNLSDPFKNNNPSNQFQVHQIDFVSSFKSTHKSFNLSLTCNINLLNKSTFNKHVWILDSDATKRVCFSLLDFSSYHCIKPILIKLANRHTISSNYYGIVHFHKKIYLIYVPKFSFNLISFSKLIFFIKCELIFFFY